MPKDKIFDVAGVSDILGIPVDPGNMSVIPADQTSRDLATVDPSGDDDFDEQLKMLLKNANEVMGAAKYLINSTPDAESIAAAAGLLSSINGIVSEFRKTNQMRKRFEYQKKLEELKIEARERLMDKKIAADKDKIKIGDGNTINIQNNNMVPFSQEHIISIIENRRKAIDVPKPPDNPVETGQPVQDVC